MNRAIRHDALLAWRETAAALNGWDDRILVAVGLALIVAGGRYAAQGMSVAHLSVAALLIAGWIGLGAGRLAARRLIVHRDDYLFAEDVLPRAGTWQYRASVISCLAGAIAGAAAGIDVRAIVPAMIGSILAFWMAVGGEALVVRSAGAGPIGSGSGSWRFVAAAVLVLAAVTIPVWWAAAPAWVAAIPVLAIAAMMAPSDAEAVRFEAIAGRPAGATVGAVLPMILWSSAAALAALAEGLGAVAIGLTVAAASAWFAALRVMAWRRVGRRSGDLIVLAIVAASALAGMTIVVLAPVAMAIATVWLWRRSQAATWLIA